MTVVLKIGGSLRDASVLAAVRGVKSALLSHHDVAVVHGGGPAITARLREAGIVLPFQDGLRVTTPEAMSIVQQVLCKTVNSDIVHTLLLHGLVADGVTSAEAVFHALPLHANTRTGTVVAVDVEPVLQRFRDGRVPVLSPVGVAADQGFCNINADLAAGHLASALQASKMVFLTDVPGIYSDFAKGELLKVTSSEELVALREQGSFSDGMLPKVAAVVAAAKAGIPEVCIVNGADAEAVHNAISGQLTDYAYGTLVRHM